MNFSLLSSFALLSSEKIQEVEFKESAAERGESPKDKEAIEKSEVCEFSKTLNLFKEITNSDEEIARLRNAKYKIEQIIIKRKEPQAKEEMQSLSEIEKLLVEATEHQKSNLQKLTKDQEIASFQKKAEFTSEEKEKIFKIEQCFRFLRETLKKEDRSLESLNSFYEEQLIPIVKAIKTSITQNPKAHIFRDAAEIGARRSHSWQGLVRIQCSGDRVVKKREGNEHAVYLRPREGIVVKQGDDRAVEEESLVEQITRFFPGNEIMLSTRIQEAIPASLGIASVKQKERLRGYSNQELNPIMRERLKKQIMSSELRSQLQEYEDHQRIVFFPDLSNPIHKNAYKACEAQEWLIKESESVRVTNFKEVHLLHLQEGGNISSRVSIRVMSKGLSDEQMFQYLRDALSVNWIAVVPEKGAGLPSNASLQQKKARGYSGPDPLVKAKIVERMGPLDRLRLKEYEEKLAKEAYRNQIIFIPDLSLPFHKEAFEACEAMSWAVKGSDKVKTFKEIQTEYLKEGHAFLQEVSLPGDKELSLAQKVNLDRALAAPWIVVFPEMLKQVKDKSETSMQVLKSFNVKPFAQRMILLSDVKMDRAFINSVFKRLTPQAQLTSILTGQLQMLDLHIENLGVEPVMNEESHRFESGMFFIGASFGNFKQLLREYVAGRINGDTLIKFQGKISAMKDIPGLSQALNTQWKLVVFDTDLSMAEGNDLISLTYQGGALQHIIPFRSTILENAGKDEPLSKECLQLLKQSESGRKELEIWMKRHDAPVWRRLSAEDKEALEKELLPAFKYYSLSRFRKIDQNITFAKIREGFSQNLSDLIIFPSIWHRLESAAVKEADTLTTFARRHRITVQKLKELNPQLAEFKEEAVLKDSNLLASEGVMRGRLKVDDLSSGSEQAAKKRLQLARQLFPRMTLGQQRAFIERIERLIPYLRDYEQLKIQSAGLSVEGLRKLIKEFYEKHRICSTSTQEETIQVLGRLDFAKLQEVITYAQPTYFKAMSIMYPLLADTYQLLKLLYPQDAARGKWIGCFEYSMEAIVHLGLASSDKVIKIKALRLSTRMKEMRNKLAASGEEHPFFIHAW